MKTVSPSPAALAAREDLLACLQRHAAQMDALELLGSHDIDVIVSVVDDASAPTSKATRLSLASTL